MAKVDGEKYLSCVLDEYRTILVENINYYTNQKYFDSILEGQCNLANINKLIDFVLASDANNFVLARDDNNFGELSGIGDDVTCEYWCSDRYILIKYKGDTIAKVTKRNAIFRFRSPGSSLEGENVFVAIYADKFNHHFYNPDVFLNTDEGRQVRADFQQR